MDRELWEKHSNVVDEDLKVLGGYERDGTPIYVGRSQFGNNIIPCNATFDGNRTTFKFSYEGRTQSVMNCELLVNTGFKWVDFNPPVDKIPSNAVMAGRTENGTALYIGRVSVDGALIIGQVVACTKRLFYPWDGREVKHYDPYQILVADNDCQRPPVPTYEVWEIPFIMTESMPAQQPTQPPAQPVAPSSTCSICLEEDVKIMGIFIECGHACLCEDCIPRVNAQKNSNGKIKCPICRKDSPSATKIFYV